VPEPPARSWVKAVDSVAAGTCCSTAGLVRSRSCDKPTRSTPARSSRRTTTERPAHHVDALDGVGRQTKEGGIKKRSFREQLPDLGCRHWRPRSSARIEPSRPTNPYGPGLPPARPGAPPPPARPPTSAAGASVLSASTPSCPHPPRSAPRPVPPPAAVARESQIRSLELVEHRKHSTLLS
jgi:hypothetical protein